MCFYLICGWSGTKIDCSTTREEAEIAKELKDFTARLVDGGYHSPWVLLGESDDTAHDMVRGSTV